MSSTERFQLDSLSWRFCSSQSYVICIANSTGYKSSCVSAKPNTRVIATSIKNLPKIALACSIFFDDIHVVNILFINCTNFSVWKNNHFFMRHFVTYMLCKNFKPSCDLIAKNAIRVLVTRVLVFLLNSMKIRCLLLQKVSLTCFNNSPMFTSCTAIEVFTCLFSFDKPMLSLVNCIVPLQNILIKISLLGG